MSVSAGAAIGRRVGAACCCLWLAWPLCADEPVYFRRLDLPLLEDSISYPRAVAADLATGEIFVCDTRRNRIVIFDAEAFFLHQIPGGDTFSAPLDLAVDPQGYLLLLANHQGRRALIELDFDGLLLRQVELRDLPEVDFEPKLGSIALSPAGDRLYALDQANLRLWVADRDGRVLASADLGQGRDERERGDLILGKLDVYGDRVLLAVSSEGLIWTYDLDGKPRGEYGIRGTAGCRLAFPAAAALDQNGDLVIVDQQRMVILRWRPQGNRCLSEHYGIGDTPGYLYYPMDLALDPQGRIYVAQGYQGKVQGYEGLSPPPLAAVMAAAEAPTPAVVEPAEAAPVPDTAEPVEEATATADGEPAVASTPADSETVAEGPAVADSEPAAEVPTVADSGPAAGASEDSDSGPAEGIRVGQGEERPPTAAAAPAGRAIGAAVARGARLSVERAPRYDASYARIAYPGGDVGADRGAAVDVVVRAFRHAGVDLQQAVQEDLLAAPEAYGSSPPDPNIDHRRIRNLVVFFARRGRALPVGENSEWLAGDVVVWDTDGDGRGDHLGIVSGERGPSGEPRVVHHHRPDAEFEGVPGDDDVLLRWPVVGHFRWGAEG